MTKAVKCPVCGGSGEVPVGGLIAAAGPHLKTCHGCGGKGWVEVSEG